ncbi:AMP deaminase [Monoraphidium neglectum]|uniref:AMP deaminase n=1 Tax=Monoraphidium neglectum TaxID=145388 RepID=A0A0D2JT76_9CHLO|nr:AMP deaminase [Monoraphidium neglectum]KIZ02128.1 AMP deaminase [Monoraphidium neglectum]|eukprot:XP_013901147.1 AMP deaminase [Monoraphidium neglectum]
MPRPQRGTSPMRQQHLNGAWQQQQLQQQLLLPPRSPRVEWLAREDVDPGEPPSETAAAPSVPEQWRRGWRSGGVPGSSGGGGVAASSGGGAPGSSGGGASAGQRVGGQDVAPQPHASSLLPVDTFTPLPPADRGNYAAMEVLRNPALHVGGGGGGGTVGGGGGSAGAPHAKVTLAATTDKLADTGKAIEAAAVLYDDYCRVITPENLLTEESEEVCNMLLACMEMRRKWLFAPAASLDQRRHEPEAASPSDIDPEPFKWRPLPRSAHRFAMVGGIIHVPGTATDFFTDMNSILRYSSVGPVKSFCHQRLMVRGRADCSAACSLM